MLIRFNDAVSLTGACTVRTPLIIQYGVHAEYDFECVAGLSGTPVDMASRGCVRWALSVYKTPSNPSDVLASAEWLDNIASGNHIRFDFAATSVEMYKHVAGDMRAPCVLELKGWEEGETVPSVDIVLPAVAMTTSQERRPVDLSTALMQELQLGVSIAGAVQKGAENAADRAENAADRAEGAASSAAQGVAEEVESRMQGYVGSAIEGAGRATSMADRAEAALSSVVAAKGQVELDSTNVSRMRDETAVMSEVVSSHTNRASQAEVRASNYMEAVSSMSAGVQSATGDVTSVVSVVSAYKDSAFNDKNLASGYMSNASVAESKASSAEIAASSHTRAASTAEDNVSSMQSDVTLKQSNVTSMQADVTAKQSDVASMSTGVEAMSSNVTSMQTDVTSKQSNVTSMQTDVSAMSSNVTSMQSDVTERQADVTSKQSNVTSMQTDVSAMSSNVTSMQTDVTTKQSNVTSMQSGVQAMSSDITTMSSQTQSNANYVSGNIDRSEQAVSSAGALLDSTVSQATAASSSADVASSQAVIATDKASSAVEAAQDVESKANMVRGDVEGHVPVLDSKGDLKDSEIPMSNVALKDGYYGKEGLGATTAENLIDPNATPEPATFGFRTAAGDLSITDGKGVVHTQFGSTEIVNQIVAPSSEKTVQGEGVVQVEDAVGGQVKGLVLTAPRSVVLNQQATVTQDVSSTGDGVVQLENAAAGNATALKMVAPRSVVVNQLARRLETTYWERYNTNYGNVTFADGVLTYTVTQANPFETQGYYTTSLLKSAYRPTLITGHVYRYYVEINPSVDGRSASPYGWSNYRAVQANTWNVIKGAFTGNANDNQMNRFYVGLVGADVPVGATYQVKNAMLVDLTQYFNGDTALINSIQSWDDLVAYDPRFAQYVEYNTGTVVGVQPTVKVTGKNLFNKNASNYESGYYGVDGVFHPSDAYKCFTIDVQQNRTYTRTTTTRWAGIITFWKGTSFVSGITKTQGTVSFDVPSGCDKCKIVIESAYESGDFQLELGSVATAYEPYFDGGSATAPSELFAVGNAADEFEAVSGVTTENCYKITLTGNEDWLIGNTQYIKSDACDAYINNYVMLAQLNGSCVGVCSHFILEQRAIWAYESFPDTCTINNNQLHLNISNTKLGITDYTQETATTVKAKIKAYLQAQYNAGTPVVVVAPYAEPATSSTTPTQISLQASSNVAMQTDGGRIASLSTTYPATVYDKAILPSRTYLHKHGSTVTKISNQSTVTLDGSDQLVDLTQLFNNDTTAVAAVSTWADLVARVPTYAATMAYNPGVVTGTVPAVKVTGKNLCSIGTTEVTYYQYRPIGGVIPPGTYTLSAVVTTTASVSSCLVYFYDVNSRPVESCTLSNNTGQRTKGTVTLNRSASRLILYSGRSSVDSTGQSSTWTDIQLEFGSEATAYEPYFDGGSVTSPSTMYGAGSAADTFDALAGKTTGVLASVDLGTLGWNHQDTIGRYWTDALKNVAVLPTSDSTAWNSICSNYVVVPSTTQSRPDTMYMSLTGRLYVVTGTAPTGTLYYSLAAPTEESSSPQPVSFQQGSNVIAQSSQDLPGVAISADYDGTEYDLKLVNGSKYVIVDNGVASYRTASSSNNTLPVHGGSTMVHNLTQWFGKGYEPASVDAFYARYPSLKGYAMAYNQGSVINYKGTAVRTEGFNFYNPATGTARLLGGNQYQICGTYASCSYVDRWGSTEELDIDEDGIFTPVNNGTLTVVGGNATDTCVHLTWSGYRNFGKEEYQWEPFWQVTTPLQVLDSFPDGMNGISHTNVAESSATSVRDELTVHGYVKRIKVRLLTGTEVIVDSNKASTGRCNYRIMFSDRLQGSAQMVRCNVLQTLYVLDGYDSPYGFVSWVSATNPRLLIQPPDDWGDMVWNIDEAAFKAKLAELYQAGTPLVIYYPVAEPEVVTFPETRLITYPVSDFGTEELLPADDEPGIPSTTWLDGRIQYEQDFLRLLINFSKIYSVLKHIADNADHIVYDDDTAPNLISGNAWNLIDREARGTMREFSYDSVNGTNDVTDGTAIAQSVHGQTLMANQLVQDSVQKTMQGTGQVEVEDAVAGDISSLVVEGRSLVKNQLVPPTMTNTKNSSNGRLGITDGVAGNAVGVTLRGGCVVHNQLVKESVEKTVTGTGRLGCEDGVAGNAKALVMTAPRSVVMNQLISPSRYVNTVTLGNVTISPDKTTGAVVVSGLCNSTASRAVTSGHTRKLVPGHIYMFHGTTGAKFYLSVESSAPIYNDTGTGVKFTAAGGMCEVGLRQIDGTQYDVTYYPQVVDLTQYFNGDTALINSIHTWDDLVAYDSSFASYVQYNTGTVKGVQPTVKVNHATDVACPVELFGVSDRVGDSFDGVNGVVTRRFGVVDSGTLNWAYYEVNGMSFFHTPVNVPTGMKAGTKLIINAKYITSEAAWSLMPDKRMCVNVTNIWVRDDSFTDATSFKAAMSGVFLYYELATPTTSQYNPTAIPTVDIYNAALQTAGSRQCPLSMTYDGREQTIALDPTHTYVFLDNMTNSSLITEQSSIDAVGGEDMLVDVTQLYNGDSTKISQIKRWASLSTRFHRYRELLPYNPGTVEPDTPVVRVFQDEHAYGAVYDPSLSSPTLKWVELNNGVITEKASFEEFSSTPCHDIWRCVMDDLATRHVNYYLDDEDSNKKYNGTRLGVTSDGSASVLTGEDGDVMSRFPVSHWYMDEDYEGEGKVLWLISDRPFMGTWTPSEIHDFFYVGSGGGTPSDQFVGSFKAVICDEDGAALNTTEGALAQATGTAATNKVRSVAGALPYVNANLDTMEARARRNGGHMTNTKFLQWLMLLMVIEEGTLNTQAKHAGYSNGIQNAFCFWRKSGRVNAGNGTAEIFADENSQDMDNFQSLKVGSTTVQRDALKDADGRYAWSVSSRGASSTRYFTDSPTPANGDTVYSESTGDATAGTVSSYTIKAENLRAIQFQYRGIENPFGETWTFEHGIQVYNDVVMVSIKVNNVVYTRDPSMDGSASRAFVHEGEYRWVGLTLPSNAHAFLDAALTQDSGYVATANAYLKYHNGYWETLDTDAYTMTAQQTAGNPAYTWRAFPWATAGNGWVKKFDPATFFAITLGGGATTYLCDYYWTTTNGSRVVFVGGNAAYGSHDGLAYRLVYYGLTFSYVSISGRLSA